LVIRNAADQAESADSCGDAEGQLGDLITLRVRDICHWNVVASRTTVMQQKSSPLGAIWNLCSWITWTGESCVYL
jgi:hypothetical protein